MTRDEGVALIKQQLAFKQTLDSVIVQNMKFAQTTLETSPEKPWWLISEEATVNTTSSEERVLVPVTFLHEVNEARLVYRPATFPDSKEVSLQKEDYDQLKIDFEDVPSGPPQAYALLGGYFRMFPLPDAIYQLRMIFYEQDTVLTANVENGWLKNNPMLLLGSTLKLVAGPIRDQVAMKTADDWIKVGLTTLTAQTVAREMGNRDGMQVGGRHW